MDNPYSIRNNAVVSWILTYNNSPFIQKYINRDVMRKILEYLKIIEIPTIFMSYRQFIKQPAFFWQITGSNNYVNPCHVCLLPTNSLSNYYCSKHNNDRRECITCAFSQSLGMSDNCFKKFKNTHILLSQ